MATTPMMQQFQQAKAACPDAVLLFRMGDFFELFHDDARLAAKVLGLSLTSRDKGPNATPMAGFPHHQLDSYLGKLIKGGHRVAICDQVEDPKKARGLVRREITRIVTPGTLTDDALLDPRESNFLAAIVAASPAGGKHKNKAPRLGLAWVELSTGHFQAAVIDPNRLGDELARISPSECLVAEDAEPLDPYLAERMSITTRPDWTFSTDTAAETLAKHFGTATLEGFGFDSDGQDRPAIRGAGALLQYLAETQKSSINHIDRLVRYSKGSTLEIDESTRRSLEITRTMREGRREGSLLAVIDRTVTPMGSRRLCEWIAAPLTDIGAIGQRHDAVEELIGDAQLTDQLVEGLRKIYDLERLLARVATGRASPRDLSFINRTLGSLPAIKAKLTARSSRLICRLEAELDLCPDLSDALGAALADDCPLASREGGLIRSGFSEQLDGLRELAKGGKQWIARYQADEAKRSGIASLKIGFNRVFGYYLEVTAAHRDKVPDDYIRKQTLKNAERYITAELKEYEEKVLSADEKSKDLEYELFLELRDAVQASASRLRATASVLATVDTLVSLAVLARERNYRRPLMVAHPRLEIIDGRHPVLDMIEAEGTFVPNDTLAGMAADGEERNGEATDESIGSEHILLITGPNMAGKSTYIRQVALITLMAQAGSFVPAARATIGIADRIFARVGASDELSRGQSTFMVEMTETARILNNATRSSLVILDEIGRGTSTYDGLALAWSVIEHLHEVIGCRTLFATHYHELTDLERSLSGLRNLNVSVREWQDDIVFLHKIVDGAADKSYGIHVARLAGVPREVNERAKQILSQLEDEHLGSDGRPVIAPVGSARDGDIQLTLFGPAEHPLLDGIRELDLDRLTPLEALSRIGQWQESLAAETEPGPR